MLVISRMAGEEFVIGGNIVVRYLGMENGKARLGIDAPKDVPIMRRELIDDGRSDMLKRPLD